MNSLATNSFNFLPSMNSTPSVTEIGTLVAAAFGAVVTFMVSQRALRDHSALGPPGLLALCTAVLAFFGLLSVGPLILIPFTALGAVCLLLPIVLLVSRRWNLPWGRSSGEPRLPRLPGLSTPAQNPPPVDPEPQKTPPRRRKRIIPLEIKQPGKDPTSSRHEPRNK